MSRRLALLALLAAPAAGWGQAQAGPAAQPVEVTAQALTIRHGEGVAEFTGNVVVVQGGLRLTAPTLTARYGGGAGVEELRAAGGVTITRPGSGGVAEKATGTTAVYRPNAGQLVLTGAVTLSRGPSQLAGDKLVYDLHSGNAQVTSAAGPVRARFVPQGGGR